MHLTEALMAAFEATGDNAYLEMAESIAALVIGKLASGERLARAEHFDENWELDRDYANGDVFRPYGTTPGHSLEWTRLLLQLWELGGRRLALAARRRQGALRTRHRGRLERGAGRLLLHPRLVGQAAHAQPALVAGGGGHRRGGLPERHRRRARNTRTGTGASGTSSPVS